METITYNVDNIKDDSDKTNIEKTIKKVDGVNKINVSLENNWIEINYDMGTASSSEIYQCIESTGHHIISESYGELDRRSENL